VTSIKAANFVPGESPPSLSDLEVPPTPAVTSLSGPPVPPQQRLFFYSGAEWELFIREWATGLRPSYTQIKLLGGVNDRGVDIAAFKTTSGFEGAWDCFQGKHYAAALTLSDAVPEILKLLINVSSGYYQLPDSYSFLAPRGCGSSLNRLLSKPIKLREEFVKNIASGCAAIEGLDEGVLGAVRLLAEEIDFAVFRSVELLDALETHRQTPYYVARFGGPLVPRPEVEDPPDTLGAHEARYVAQLVEVYSEKHPDEDFRDTELLTHKDVGGHFRRQRISFYSAEALRLYARDSVPEGTFEALQQDIHSGVIDVAESDCVSGFERLRKVLAVSGQLDLSSHTLVSVSSITDRKGICHQLANEDRLTWVDPGQ
jgi:hypothetical protein